MQAGMGIKADKKIKEEIVAVPSFMGLIIHINAASCPWCFMGRTRYRG
jgi:hypothetical protein